MQKKSIFAPLVKSLKDQIDPTRLPRHVAVIMDGNGRWAKTKGAARIFGHQHAVQATREVIEGSGELGIGYLTLYAFSTENWQRPKAEVDALMNLMIDVLDKELDNLIQNGVKLSVLGNWESLPEKNKTKLAKAIEQTKHLKGLQLIIALSYSGRWEIVEAAKKLAQTNTAFAAWSEQAFAACLPSYSIPDPELLIRTGGEQRISNFLLWQMAYTEFYFTSTLWPDFRKADLHAALIDYQTRERRFGKISEKEYSA